jgi:hypothetical protein
MTNTKHLMIASLGELQPGLLEDEIGVGFEVFRAVVMKSIFFWDMTPCSLLSFNRRFGGTYHLHLQGRRNRFSKHEGCKTKWE